MRYCRTKDQIIDILTKDLKEGQFSKLKINMWMMAFDSEVGMASESSVFEGVRGYNNLASEATTSEGVRGWSSLAYEALLTSEPSPSEGVRGGNNFWTARI